MRMMSKVPSPWRDALLPASFRGAMFHVESGGKESGRRIVVHQWPKKDFPYPEDMGRRAYEFNVRGYCIQFVNDNGIAVNAPLYQRDYRVPRDILIAALETEGPGVLQLPTTKPILVVCPQYRWIEDEQKGGYVAFDMHFIEFGVTPSPAAQSSMQTALQDAQDLRNRVLAVMSGSP